MTTFAPPVEAKQAPLQRPSSLAAPASENAPSSETAPLSETTPSSEEGTEPEALEDDPSETDPARRPPPPRVRRDSAAATGSGTHLKKAAHTKPEEYEHAGFTLDFRFGTAGCFRDVCSGARHAASPGVRLDGFLGGNIKGWVDLGISGGWGTFGSDVEQGTNALDLYGIDSAQLVALTQALGNPLGFDLNSLRVQDSKLRMARGGPSLRVHFIPRGRYAAYLGTGVGYSLFRARYQTTGGDLRLDFHGVDIPVEGGFAVHVTKNISVGAQVQYIWTRYGLATLKHPEQTLTAPLRVLDDAVSAQGFNLQKQLPQYWTVGALARANF